jgi:hypothetical protein
VKKFLRIGNHVINLDYIVEIELQRRVSLSGSPTNGVIIHIAANEVGEHDRQPSYLEFSDEQAEAIRKAFDDSEYTDYLI